MTLRQLSVSRRSLIIAAALVGMVSLAIGAHAALNKRSLDAAKATEAAQIAHPANKASRLALVIGNGHYPDASAPLIQPINDARAITAALRREGFAVDVVEDGSRADIEGAVDYFSRHSRLNEVPVCSAPHGHPRPDPPAHH